MLALRDVSCRLGCRLWGNSFWDGDCIDDLISLDIGQLKEHVAEQVTLKEGDVLLPRDIKHEHLLLAAIGFSQLAASRVPAKPGDIVFTQ